MTNDMTSTKQTMTAPKAGVGAVVFHENKVLLVKRASPPCQGEWAIPGGKIKLGETLQAAAEREILEETGLTIKAGKPIYHFELIDKDSRGSVNFHYIIIDLAAEYVTGKIKASSDASAAAWFGRSELSSLNLNQTTKQILDDYPDFEF